MPSPFPGMDPYLEGDLWQEFHDRLANQISQLLLPQLPPRYAALLAKRYVMDRPALGIAEAPETQVIYPDVHVIQSPTSIRETAVAPVLRATPPTVIVTSPVPDEVPVLSIEIRDVADRRLVTVIEILSPVNKRGDGAREYHERRLALLATKTHLLELDLLTRGLRIQVFGALPRAPYYVYLSRFDQRPRTDVWAITLRDALPAVPVPLLPPDADVLLDLQAAVDSCFAWVGYERLLDYRADPPAYLDGADAAWVAARLVAAGLREQA
jgi:hypothetical protein